MRKMNCPRCDTPLVKEKIEKYYPNIPTKNIEVDVCSSCTGIWFDRGELEKINHIVDPTYIEIRKIPSRDDQNISLKCPKCENKVLDKIENERDVKVIMDVCPDCGGIWLDGGELKAIQQENLYFLLFKAMKWVLKSKE